MCMRHFEPHHTDTAPVAVECLFDGMCNGFGKYQHFTEVTVGQVEQFVCFCFGYHQHMPFAERENIEECKEPFILRNLVRRNFPGDYS